MLLVYFVTIKEGLRIGMAYYSHIYFEESEVWA